MTFFIFGAFFIPFIIFINVLLFHIIIKSAIKRIVKPVLENNRLTYVDYKWVGFWDCGDFKNEGMDFALFQTGINTLSIYSFLYYKDLEGIKRITIKIYVLGLSIDKVEFSNGLK